MNFKKDRNCNCTGCFTTKFLEALNEPIPNVVKAETIRINHINYYEKCLHAGDKIEGSIEKMMELIKNIDVYSDIDDIKRTIEIVVLYAIDDTKKLSLEDSQRRVIRGMPEVTDERRANRIYENQKSLGTIFEEKEL